MANKTFEIINLRDRYFDLIAKLHSGQWDDNPASIQAKKDHDVKEKAPGRVCGICGLNSMERMVLVKFYKQAIEELESLNA